MIKKTDKNLFWIYALSASVYFLQGTESLVNLPFFFYLKNTLHLDPSRIMFLTSWITVAWLIKPILGYLIDSSKYSKKAWVIGSLIGSLGFAVILGIVPYLPVFWLIILMALANFNTASRDVAADGIMACEGKQRVLTGKIQAIQWGFLTVATILTGICGGWLSEHVPYQISYIILIPIYLIIIQIVIKYNSEPNKIIKRSSFPQMMVELFTDKRLLLVCLFVFLYKLAPAFGTPLTFIMQDQFHWSQTFIGFFDTVSAATGLIGAFIYFHCGKSFNLSKWLTFSVIVGAVTTLCYLVFNPVTAWFYDITFSIIGMFINLLILDFMARNTKRGLESTSFALLCSISNLANMCNGFLGSFLFPLIGLQWLIIISAVASFLCLPIIPLLKERKDAHN